MAEVKEEISKEEKKTAEAEERSFLEGPRRRFSEMFFLLQVMREFIRGFRKLHFIGPCVTVFGSARFREGHPYYEKAREVGAGLAKLGFTTLTGGGPGIMEAANRGAYETGGISVGCNIILPHEQKPNPYLHKWVDIRFFFVRKVLLSKYSYAFIVLPGGYGTMDEFFEALTLVETGKMKPFPIIVIGKEFHEYVIAHIEQMKNNATISASDAELVLFTDSVDEAMSWLNDRAIAKYGLRRTTIRPIGIFGEKKFR